jgi:hypothetical protein
MTKQEKKTIFCSVCGVISRMLKLCGGRWKGVRDLAGITLTLTLPLLSDYMVDRSITESEKVLGDALGYEVIQLVRYYVSNRLSLDSAFLPHLKERSSARTVGAEKNSTDKKVHAVVEGQWVGGTTGGQTHTQTPVAVAAAVAAVQRQQLLTDELLTACEMDSLRLCLAVITQSSGHMNCDNKEESSKSVSESVSVGVGGGVENIGGEVYDGEDRENKIDENRGKNGGDKKGEEEKRKATIENAVIAVHSILLGRSREAAGAFILELLKEDNSSAQNYDDVVTNKTEVETESINDNKVIEMEKQKNPNKNNQNISKIALKLQEIVSNNTGNKNNYTGMTRLITAKVIDVWYSAGGGMSKKLLDAEDNNNDGDNDDNEEEGGDRTNSNGDGDEKINGIESENSMRGGSNRENEKENDNDNDSMGGGVKVEKEEVEEDEEVKELKRCEKIFQLLMGVDIAEEIVTRFKATGERKGRGSVCVFVYECVCVCV